MRLWRADVGTASLQIPPTPDQVRLARLVAGAAARRCGVDEDVLDEVRLAVGEACALAVIKHQDTDLAADIRIELTDFPDRFSVRVFDQIPSSSTSPDTDESMALALISSLAPESAVEAAGPGTVVEMTWPIEGPALARPELG
ncbi:MAG TPA: anti-sigma regulatory factor [Actinobacteria bacterium]|jgi:anti-sigma regulatory factor (Ser/Thr protein kinase)|nr:anti-sigma regulatory factor [Actinomycetota bacterium]